MFWRHDGARFYNPIDDGPEAPPFAFVYPRPSSYPERIIPDGFPFGCPFAGGIGNRPRAITAVNIQVHPTTELDRVLAQPAADTGIVPAVEVVLQASVGIEWSGREELSIITHRIAQTDNHST